MKKLAVWVTILFLANLLIGCQGEMLPLASTKYMETEPTAIYNWMAGESPISNTRTSIVRSGLCYVDHAISPKGIYFIDKKENSNDTYILYVDNGSDTIIKLCGRVDCNHNTADCNSYLYMGSDISYHNGHLYAITGEGPLSDNRCNLIRMDADGSNRITLIDLQQFAVDYNGDYVQCDRIFEGVCLFSIYKWEDNGRGGYRGAHKGYYYYKLDGSMKKPEEAKTGGLPLYSCGDVFLTVNPDSVNGGVDGSYWDWNPEENTKTFLTDHPGVPGWFGEKEAYYYKNGALYCLDYNTQKEYVMVDTGLEGDYYAFILPDCIVVGARGYNLSDNNLYFYNWEFELVDTIEIRYSHNYGMEHLLIAETSERFFLTDNLGCLPLYYINKSELGTGNVEIYKFAYR